MPEIHLESDREPKTESLRPSGSKIQFCDNPDICENGFSRFTKKVKVLELRDVLSANINMHIPVILS